MAPDRRTLVLRVALVLLKGMEYIEIYLHD